jgi:hypothetical protein
MLLKSRWGCQNHPEASIATSFAGLPGVVSISGHIIPPLLMANRCDGVRDTEGVNEEQVDSRVPMAAAIAFMVTERANM